MFDKFFKIIDGLNRHNVDYILIGGYAVILYGYKRFTGDIDLFIKNSDENLKNLRNALSDIYNDNYINEITSSELKKYCVLRYGTPDNFNIDIIENLGEMSYNDIKFEVIELNNIKIRVATPDSLYKMKENTMRPIDKMDILFLKELINKRKNADL